MMRKIINTQSVLNLWMDGEEVIYLFTFIHSYGNNSLSSFVRLLPPTHVGGRNLGGYKLLLFRHVGMFFFHYNYETHFSPYAANKSLFGQLFRKRDGSQEEECPRINYISLSTETIWWSVLWQFNWVGVYANVITFLSLNSSDTCFWDCIFL